MRTSRPTSGRVRWWRHGHPSPPLARSERFHRSPSLWIRHERVSRLRQRAILRMESRQYSRAPGPPDRRFHFLSGDCDAKEKCGWWDHYRNGERNALDFRNQLSSSILLPAPGAAVWAASGWARSVEDHSLLGDEVSDFLGIDEMSLVLGRGLPLRRLTRRQQILDRVEPKFRHAVKIRRASISRKTAAVALHQSPQAGNPRADRSVNVLPVSKEFLIRHASLLVDAIYKLDHGRSIHHCVLWLRTKRN